jgi:hypothetical protein
VIFLSRDGRAVGVPGEAFVSLETALLEAQAWSPLPALSEGLTSELATELPEVYLGGVGIRPLRDVPSPSDLEGLPVGGDPQTPARGRPVDPKALPPSGTA